MSRPRERYVLRSVSIPREVREFDAFVIQWMLDRDEVYVVDHWAPEKKLAYWQNKSMRDFKNALRSDVDHSRAASLRLVNYRNKDYSRALFGALQTGDPGVTADSALYAYNVIGD